MGKNLHWLLITTVLVLSIAMASVVTASPELPVIRVEPKDNTAEVGETFTVSITVTGITEEESLYGWECRITFSPSIINAVNATEELFLKKVTGYNTFWRMNIDNANGTVDLLAMFEFGGLPPTGATGSGTLATITFKAVGQGATNLEFKEEKDMELHTVYGEAPNQYDYPIDHTAEGGFFRNAGSPIPPYLIAGVVVAVAVAVCTVAVFYFRRKRVSAKPRERSFPKFPLSFCHVITKEFY